MVVVLVAPVVLVLLWLALSYNRFVSQRASIASTWAGIDVQLQRRHDLVPNLVETVRAYAAHERAVFEQVTRARADAVPTEAEDRLSAARRLYNIEVQQLNRRVEAFPSNLVASMFGFEPAAYFELTDLARRPPWVTG